MKKFTYYLIYDKKTGEIYHTNLHKHEIKRQVKRGKLFGFKVKAMKQVGYIHG